MPLAARENATKAMIVSTITEPSPRTPAAAGAATTSTFFIHCFGRAVRMRPESSEADGSGVGSDAAPDGVGTGSAIRSAYLSPGSPPTGPAASSRRSDSAAAHANTPWAITDASAATRRR